MDKLEKRRDKLKRELIGTHSEVGEMDQELLDKMAESMAELIMTQASDLALEIAEHFVRELGLGVYGFDLEVITRKIFEQGVLFIENAKENQEEEHIWH